MIELENDRRKARFEKQVILRTMARADVEIEPGPCWIQQDAESVLVHWPAPARPLSAQIEPALLAKLLACHELVYVSW